MSKGAEPQTRLDEQFGSLEQQEHAAHLGMWLFLTSEVLLFGALFALYTAYRFEYADAFRSAARQNNVWLGTTNTLVLITSSLLAAWAVQALKRGRAVVAELCLFGTIALGGVFLCLKLTEYADHFRHDILPGGYYRGREATQRGASLFFTLYYLMTGLHGLHVLGGMSALGTMLVRTLRGRYGSAKNTAVELSVLYWHLVDVIWLFLWPLFYLLT
jgi:cytochrome c oxidase subunit 3